MKAMMSIRLNRFFDFTVEWLWLMALASDFKKDIKTQDTVSEHLEFMAVY
jgi:hypothetical protein